MPQPRKMLPSFREPTSFCLFLIRAPLGRGYWCPSWSVVFPSLPPEPGARPSSVQCFVVGPIKLRLCKWLPLHSSFHGAVKLFNPSWNCTSQSPISLSVVPRNRAGRLTTRARARPCRASLPLLAKWPTCNFPSPILISWGQSCVAPVSSLPHDGAASVLSICPGSFLGQISPGMLWLQLPQQQNDATVSSRDAEVA